ncbi:MAG: helix-turn-helix domain-containing protein [Frankiaceae bacterium]
MTNDLGQRVSNLRRRKGMTQVELGRAVGVDPSFLSLVEKGKRRPSDRVIRALAAQLGTTVEHLTNGTNGRGGDLRSVELDLRFAEVALRTGDPASARDRFAAAHEQAIALGDGYVAEQYEALWGLARAFQALGQYREAIVVFEALLAERELPSTVHPVTVQMRLCRAYTSVGDLRRAIDLGESALAGIGPLDKPDAVVSDELVELASTLAAAYQERGDLTRAQTLIDTVVVAAEATDSMRARGAAYWTAATVAEASGEIRAAIKLADRALALYGEIGQAFAVAALTGNIAAYSLRLPDPDLAGAEARLRQSIAGMTEDGSPADVAVMETELARCHLLAGRIDEAVDIARTALERATAAPLERARALAVLAAALLASGQADKAVSAYEAAAEALEGCVAARQAALVWRELAAVLDTMDRQRDAIGAFVRMAAALGVPDVPVRPLAAVIRADRG